MNRKMLLGIPFLFLVACSSGTGPEEITSSTAVFSIDIPSELMGFIVSIEAVITAADIDTARKLAAAKNLGDRAVFETADFWSEQWRHKADIIFANRVLYQLDRSEEALKILSDLVTDKLLMYTLVKTVESKEYDKEAFKGLPGQIPTFGRLMQLLTESGFGTITISSTPDVMPSFWRASEENKPHKARLIVKAEKGTGCK